MLASQMTTRVLSRVQPQRRTIVNFLMNYPDKVLEKQKIQIAGGVKLGGDNPTWLKQPGDKMTAYFGGALTAYGLYQIGIGIYYLATGKGKMD